MSSTLIKETDDYIIVDIIVYYDSGEFPEWMFDKGESKFSEGIMEAADGYQEYTVRKKIYKDAKCTSETLYIVDGDRKLI